MGFIKKNLLTLLVTPLLILLVAGSFYRFVVLRDYMVTYEIDCDPTTDSCYEYCEDEACAEPYYYAYMEKYAAAVHKQCGLDIIDCESASMCLPEDGDMCTITYCDAETEECDEPIEPEEVPEEEIELNAEPIEPEPATEHSSSTETELSDPILQILDADTNYQLP